MRNAAGIPATANHPPLACENHVEAKEQTCHAMPCHAVGRVAAEHHKQPSPAQRGPLLRTGPGENVGFASMHQGDIVVENNPYIEQAEMVWSRWRIAFLFGL